MVFKLHLLLFGATILWLSSVNGQIVQPGYTYDEQPQAAQPQADQPQADQPYSYNPNPRQIVKIITSDPNLLRILRAMDPQKLQDLVNRQLFPYLDDYNIPANTVFNVQVGEARTRDSFYPGPLIRPPAISNIRPSTFIRPGPFGPNIVRIGGMGTLGPSLLGRDAENYEVGRPQTRSVDSLCTSDPNYCRDDVSSRSSLTSSAEVVDLHQINVRDNGSNQGWGNEGNFQNTNGPNGKEFTNQVVNAVQSELLHLLRNMNKDGSYPQNGNFSIDTAEIRNILQKYTPANEYFSEMEESYRSQNFNPSGPYDPLVDNYDNNGWNPMNGNLNSDSYPNDNGRNTDFNYSPMNNGQFGNPNNNYQPMNNGQFRSPNNNYQPMNNGQFGNPNYNSQPMNNGQLGNPNNNYQPMNKGQMGNPNYNSQPMNNGQIGNPNYNSQPMNNKQSGTPNFNNQPMNSKQPGTPNFNNQPMNNNGQLSNPTNNYQPMNNNGQFSNPNNNYPAQNINGPGNFNNFPPMNNTGRPDNVNNSISNMSNNRKPGNSTNNFRPMNNNGLPVNPNYNAPPMNSQIPGFSNSSPQPSMSYGRPDSANLNTVSQIQNPQVPLPYSGFANPVYQYQMPMIGYVPNNPQTYNPYDTFYAPYTRATFT